MTNKTFKLIAANTVALAGIASAVDVNISVKGKETVDLQFRGRLHLDYNSLADDKGGETTNQFYFRRLRLGAKATLANDMTAEAIYEFSGDDARIDTAVIGYKDDFGGSWKLGYQKVPFGFQEVLSSNKIKTVERSAANRLFIDDSKFGARATGIHYKTDLDHGLSFAAALTNSDQGETSRGSNQLAIYTSLRWENEAENLLVGVDYGDQSTQGSELSAYTAYVNYKFWGLDLLGEYFDGDNDNSGYAIRLAYRSSGKWEHVYRYSKAEADNGGSFKVKDLIRRSEASTTIVSGSSVATSADEISSHYIGANYYYSKNVRFMGGYEYATADLAGAEVSDISGFRARVQVTF